jgi:hypothetical protein
MWDGVEGGGARTHWGRRGRVAVVLAVVIVVGIHGGGVSGVCRVRLIVLHGQEWDVIGGFLLLLFLGVKKKGKGRRRQTVGGSMARAGQA